MRDSQRWNRLRKRRRRQPSTRIQRSRRATWVYYERAWKDRHVKPRRALGRTKVLSRRKGIVKSSPTNSFFLSLAAQMRLRYLELFITGNHSASSVLGMKQAYSYAYEARTHNLNITINICFRFGSIRKRMFIKLPLTMLYIVIFAWTIDAIVPVLPVCLKKVEFLTAKLC